MTNRTLCSEEHDLAATANLDAFLASVERRALRIAEFATGSREEALDIVQDAMLKLAQRYADRDADEWAPLFQRILQNRIRDWYRRSKVRRRWTAWLRRGDGDQDDPLEALPDGDHVRPDHALSGERALRALQEVFQTLPLRQQQAVVLRLWEGLDVAQTADAMGCSAGSVKTHYSRAIGVLREKLGAHWP
jgi:RNA polymerase sigma-70 factor (ECF subfamily)